MTQKRVIVIRPNGTVRTMWSDALPLREMGHVSAMRASSVEWDEEHQLWVARDNDGKIIAIDKDRDAAIAQEVAVLQRRL
jgi:hypothetical protein